MVKTNEIGRHYSKFTTKGEDGMFYPIFVTETDNEAVFYACTYSTRTSKERYRKEPNIINQVTTETIDAMQNRFGPHKRTLAKILSKLQSTPITNHFDYLQLLKTITPDIEKLLQ